MSPNSLNAARCAAIVLLLDVVSTVVGAQSVPPSFTVSTHAGPIALPQQVAHDEAGALFVGTNDGSPAARKIYRVGPGGSPVSEYGLAATPDPDAVAYDGRGLVSGVPGTVIVGGNASSVSGRLSAIGPDEVVTTLVESTGFRNPNQIVIEDSGRLLFCDDDTDKCYQYVGGVLSVLFSSSPDFRIAVSPDGRIFTCDSTGRVRIRASDGSLIDDNFSTLGGGLAFLAFAPCGPFEGDLYALGSSSGVLYRVSPTGVATVFGTGFPSLATSLSFSNGDLFVSAYSANSILRVTWAGGVLALSSAASAVSIPVTGSVVEQVATINAGPPPSSGSWGAVWRHQDFHVTAGFVCPPVLGVIATAPAIVEAAPPSDIGTDQWVSTSDVRVFDEQVNVILPSPLSVDLVVPGCGASVVVDSSADLTGGELPAGTAVNSHLIHFDTPGSTSGELAGSVTFDAPILALVATTAALDLADLTHSELKRGGVAYPVGDNRGLELDDASQGDDFGISSDRRTLHYHGWVENWLDELRVITAGSANAEAMPYVDAESFLAGDDEVTRDNCGSAFYRFTFDLPVHENPRLCGVANVDDVAVAFLNGNRISPGLLMSDAFCVDRRDAGGVELLSGPSADSFGTSEQTFFRVGENELVFGVCGDAGPSEPTGVEFHATVYYDSLDVSAALAQGAAGPASTRIVAVTPNPTARRSTVVFTLEVEGEAEVAVFDVAGRVVRELVRGRLPAGQHSAVWDGTGADGRRVAAGLYFLRLSSLGVSSAQRLVLLR